MDKRLSILNLFLILTAGILIIMIIRIWTDPSGLSRIEDSSLSAPPKSFQKLSAERKTYKASIVSKITSKNLFRKERTEFKKARSPVFVTSAPRRPPLPPPDIKVKGIMLLRGIRIAVLKGSYSVRIGATTVEKKDIKKKGYRVGHYIGDYQITKIDRVMVTLQNKHGNTLTLILKRETSSTPISRNGANLRYKPSKPVGNKPVPVSKPKNKLVQAAPVTHISGRPQTPARLRASISGARTAPQRTRPHISGR